MKTALLCFATLLLAPAAVFSAAEPSPEKTDLFVAGQGDYKLYRSPGIVVTKSGQAKQLGDLPQIVPANTLPGIVLDNEAAEFTGSWVSSSIQPPLVGATYQHDNNTDRGRKRAMFTPEIPATGKHEVRLLYTCHENRATNASVTIHSADGEQTVTVNQRQPVLVDRVPRALGVFRFDAGTKGNVVVSNKDADGYVVVDGVQFVPVKIAREERAQKRDPGFADIKRPVDPARVSTQRREMAAAVAVSPLAPKTAPVKAGERSDEPVQLATSASAAAVDGKSYDVVVVGGTGGGVACAVRAAREGCTVLLVQHNGHIGGMMTNGLMQWDALYGGPRSPLFTELLGNIEDYYIATFGRDSPVHQIIRYTHEHYPIGWADSPETPHTLGDVEPQFNAQPVILGGKTLCLLKKHYSYVQLARGPLIDANGWAHLETRGVSDFELSEDITGAAAFPEENGRLRMVVVERNGKAYELGISADGQLASLPVPTTLPGLDNCTSLAWLDGQLLAADSGEIIVFDRTEDGDWRASSELRGFGSELYIHSDGERLAVSDTENCKVHLYDSLKTKVATYAALNRPTHIAVSGDQVAVYDAGNQRLVKLELSPGAAAPDRFAKPVPLTASTPFSHSFTEADYLDLGRPGGIPFAVALAESK